jgi:hypothetical protein
LLLEVPEAEAEGLVAELYEDIRHVLGLPLVNLVYRHLAVEPERLRTAWRQLRPNLTDATADRGAEELLRAPHLEVPPFPLEALRAVGLGRADLGAVAATIDAYNYANPRNLLALLSLLHGADGSGGATPREATGPVGEILPIASLPELDEATLALLQEMSIPFAARGEATLVPGLLRHFAFSPALLALFWMALRPLARGGAIAREGNVVAAKARRLAAALPHPVEATRDPETRAVLLRFGRTVPRMIVAGVALRGALDEAAGAG